MRTVRLLPLILLVVIVVAIGCGTGQTQDTASTTTTTALQTTTTTSGDRPAISDGSHFGFLREVDVEGLVFDPADLLTGEAALAAARDAGIIGPDEDLPNDFFIANPEQEQLLLRVDPAAQFTLIDSSGPGGLADKSVSYAELIELWNGSADASAYYGFVAGELPVTIAVSDGVVSAAKQEYLP